jgi:hypothetical protein
MLRRLENESGGAFTHEHPLSVTIERLHSLRAQRTRSIEQAEHALSYGITASDDDHICFSQREHILSQPKSEIG